MSERFLRTFADRRWRLAGAAGLLLLTLAGFGFVGRVVPDGVATVQVKPGRFVREVEARGSLKAVKATPILVPPESGRQQKVAFLVKDGAFVKAGETVVEFDPYDAEREAVFLRESGPVVWARRAFGWDEVQVKLGRSNSHEVEVLSGVAEGDRLSPVDLGLPKDRQATTPSGSAG